MGSGSRITRRLLVAVFFCAVLSASGLVFAQTNDVSTITFDSVITDHPAGTADGSLADGWKWEFHVTIPSSETTFKMKFSDFTNGTDSIPASNIRFFSPQSGDNASEGGAVAVTSAGAWSATTTLALDDDVATPGRQIVVVVEVAIPQGTPDGSYGATYDIESDAPPALVLPGDTAPVITINGGSAEVLQGFPYEDAGATATDDTDGDITGLIVAHGLPIDTSVPGHYTVTYDVTDAAGNHAVQAVRDILVIPRPPGFFF